MEGIEYPSYDELDDAVRLPVVACTCVQMFWVNISCACAFLYVHLIGVCDVGGVYVC